MASALTLLLIGCLLQGALCVFKASVPQTIQVLRGSCVTIPCSFDVDDQYQRYLDETCKAVWRNDQGTVVFDSSSPQSKTIKGNLTGDLKRKDCTTTLNNIEQNKYFFRLQCDNDLKQTFHQPKVDISVIANPPRPTLTPSTLRMKEGSSVSLKCSAPAPCLSHPPTLTWTPSLGVSQETMQEEQDKTEVKTSVLTFTASHLHHGQEISCTAVYSKENGSNVSSVSSLTADISYSPKDTTVSVSPSGPVRENSIVTLTCNGIANPAVRSYTWHRADGGQETIVGTEQVLNITASKDSAPFYCKTENELGVGRSESKQIDVQYSPKDTTVSVSPSGPVPEDSIVTLTCNSIANPAVRSYTWYRADGGQETVVGTGRVLNITASKISAPFYCKTENGVGAGRSNISQIDVQYSPKDTTVSVSPSGPVPEDSIVTLTCNSIANPAVRSYTWYRAGGQETVVGTGRILNITASKISAPFYCKTENGVGAGRSNISQIDVQYSPKDTTVSVSPSGPVPEDSIVTLTCNSTANPEVRSYTWYRADGGQETVVGIGRVLNITASKISARFICKTENKLGTGRSNISQIDVQYSPKDTTVSASPSGPVPEDSIVTLTCKSTANPEVRSYTWYRTDGGQETIVGTEQVLNIIASKVSAHFYCKTENGLGTGRSNIPKMDVHFTPKILSSDCTKTADQLNCSCQTVGNPSPTLLWYLNGLPVNQSDKFAISNETLKGTGLSSILTVTQPQWRDLSTLLCQSSNSLGSTVQRFHVYSLEPQTEIHGLGILLLAVAGVSLSVNVLYTVYVVVLCKARKSVKPKEEDQMYMSLDRRDTSPEYDVIGQNPR